MAHLSLRVSPSCAEIFSIESIHVALGYEYNRTFTQIGRECTQMLAIINTCSNTVVIYEIGTSTNDIGRL